MRLVWICLSLALVPPAPASESIKATTGEPAFVENFTPTRPMPRKTFEEQQRWGADDDRRIAIRKLPNGTTDAARFGVLQFDQPLIYMIEPGVDGASKIFVDRNRDGDFTNDPPVAMRLAEAPFDKKKSWLIVVPEPDGKASIKLILPSDASMAYVFETQTRQGLLEIGERTIKFALFGRRGVYNEPYNGVYLDTDGDGEIPEFEGREDVYEVSERYLYVDDRRYGFEVARDGSSMTLTEAPGGKAPPSVSKGSPAVRFSFVDMEGSPGTLGDYEGNVVLLYFWGTWCGPCIEYMPTLAQTYREFQPQGFRVLAIAKQSLPDDVRAIMTEHDLDWRHVLEDDTTPIAKLYRTRGVPDYVLIDAAGTIVHRGRAMDLTRELTALYAPQSATE